jgi:hypothetical protein
MIKTGDLRRRINSQVPRLLMGSTGPGDGELLNLGDFARHKSAKHCFFQLHHAVVKFFVGTGNGIHPKSPRGEGIAVIQKSFLLLKNVDVVRGRE